LEEG
jgi:hypothetical protein